MRKPRRTRNRAEADDKKLLVRLKRIVGRSPFTIKEAAVALKLPKDVTRRLLIQLNTVGYLARIKRGRYEVVRSKKLEKPSDDMASTHTAMIFLQAPKHMVLTFLDAFVGAIKPDFDVIGFQQNPTTTGLRIRFK